MSDPLESPCGCRFHVKCGEHYLSVLDIRSNDYRSLVTCMYGNFMLAGHKVAVDHIIELWEVRRAFYRAIRLFEQWQKPADWAPLMKYYISNKQQLFPTDPIRDPILDVGESGWAHLNWPINFTQKLGVLYELELIFNNKNNLCLIASDFNLEKNQFLMKTTASNFTDVNLNKTQIRLFKYYLEVLGLRMELYKTLLQKFRDTGCLVFWAVWRILEENFRDFKDDCKKGDNLNSSQWKDAIKVTKDEWFSKQLMGGAWTPAQTNGGMAKLEGNDVVEEILGLGPE